MADNDETKTQVPGHGPGAPSTGQAPGAGNDADNRFNEAVDQHLEDDAGTADEHVKGPEHLSARETAPALEEDEDNPADPENE